MKKFFIGQYRFCDILTMCGTLSAILGIILVVLGHFNFAVVLMLICALCDSFDGYFARKHKNTEFQSSYGSELDSLSDMICFGVFPGIFLFESSALCITKYIIPIFILCGLIRLAYFNTLNITKTNEKGYFRGVPITTIAFIYPLVYLLTLINFDLFCYAEAILFSAMAILFVSNIRVKKPDISKLFNK